LEEHGGAPGRLERYQNNAKTLVDGMRALGFSPYVDESNQGCIITTFLVPDDPKFNFKTVYNKLEERGFIIYPGKTTKAESFRLGSIGRLFDHDMRAVVQALKEVLIETGVSLPVIQKRE
jgi:2-aminoethylphosphonate-pyruvate transaminase